MSARLRAVAETGSTNDDVRGALPDFAEGDWLRADRQTAGRGRRGRDWSSTSGNLHASTVVHLRSGDPPAPTLSFVAALAVFSTIAERLSFAPDLLIKWPNDVLWNGAKLAGVLLEGQARSVVVGVGLNLATAPAIAGRRTLALAELGIVLTPDAALAALADAFARWLAAWRGSLAEVVAEWRRRAHPAGTALTAVVADGTQVDGAFERIDADGALVLRLADGERRVIHAADVFLG